MSKQQIGPITSLDRRSPVPLYHQLYEALFHAIESGQYPPGESFPSEKELEAIYHVSQITVRKALAKLVAEGCIVRRPGRGSFVLRPKLRFSMVSLEDPSDRYVGQVTPGTEVEHEIHDLGVIPAPDDIAARLEIESGEPVFHFLRLTRLDGSPQSASQVHLNLGEDRIFTHDELVGGSVIPLLKRKYDIDLIRVDQFVEAVDAQSEPLARLGLDADVPMLSIDSLFFDAEGKPIALARVVHQRGSYQFRQTVIFRRT